jgi:hypothetical protein
MKTVYYFNFALTLFLANPLPGTSQSDSDAQLVKEVLYNYMDGFYKGDSTLFHRSIDPKVNKFGYYLENGKYIGDGMSFREMIGFAKNVREGKFQFKTNPRREAIVLEVNDKTACGKVLADWGFDYILLAKENNQWLVKYVLWQNDPPPEK